MLYYLRLVFLNNKYSTTMIGRHHFLILVFVCIGFSLLGQSVTVTEDAPIGHMMEVYERANKSTTTIPGWRLQILASADRRVVEKALQKFKSNFPNIKNVDWEHKKPYYILRAGSFATRLETLRVKKEISHVFHGAYPAKDRIAKSDLL